MEDKCSQRKTSEDSLSGAQKEVTMAGVQVMAVDMEKGRQICDTFLRKSCL